MRKVRVFSFIFVFVLVCVFALAQGPPTGKFEGKITDDQGNPLPGVEVQATSPKLLGKASTVSSGDGAYRLLGLPSGVYEITFSIQGFKTLIRKDVLLQLQQSITLNVTMETAAIEESVTVVGQSPLIDVKSTVRGMTITKDVFSTLPRGRNFESLITALPGVSNETMLGGTSVDGASGLENMYYVDGADITDIIYGDRGQDAAFEFVDEVQMRTSGYQAEFGGSLGGVFSVITRSGGNTFHGELLGYYSGAKLRGNYRDTLELDFLDDSKAAYYPYNYQYGKNEDRTLEGGGSLGGYIFKDRLWFFGSFLPVFYHNDRTVTYDLSAGKPVKTWKRDQTNYNFSAKLTSQVFSKLRISASVVNNFYKYKGDLSNIWGNPNPAQSFDDYGFSYPNFSASGIADVSLGNSVMLSIRGGYFKTDRNKQLVVPPDEPCFQFLTEAPGGYFRTGNTGLLDVPSSYQKPTGYMNYSRANAMVVNKNVNEKYSVSGDLTYFLNMGGEHAWKFGGQWVRQGQNYDATAKNPVLFFAWNRDFVAYGVNYGRGKYGYYAARGNDVTGPYGDFYQAYSNRWAFYIQDSWTIGSKLTLNFGVRTESEFIPSYATGNPDFENLKPIEFGFDKKMAPRLGLVYDVYGDSSLKLFASLGWFYDVMKLQMASGSYGGFKWKSVYYSLDTYEWDKIGRNGYFPGRKLYTGNAAGTLDFRAPSFDSTDPDMSPMSMREISIGAEKKLRDDLALSIRGVNKHLLWAIEDIGVLYPDGEHYFTTNPGGTFINSKYAEARGNGLIPATAPDCPKAKREYYALNISLDKRFSNNWLGGISYTLSSLKGNYNGLASGDEYGRTDPNTERYFDLWYLAFDKEMNPVDGPLPGDRPHYFKAYGSYTFPFGLTAGLIVNAMSGLPTSTEYAMDVQGYLPFNRNDMGRTPFLWFANAYVAQQFKLGPAKLEVNLNVDNVFDIATAQRIYGIYTQGATGVTDEVIAKGGWDIENFDPVYDPRYKKEMSFYGPINARVGLRLMF